jgi:hypothetical protein
MCFAPLLLIGYLFTLHPNPSHTTSLNHTVLDVQTCEQGPGLDLKAASSGVYGAHAQYGFSLVNNEGTTSFTLTPKFGVGFLDHTVPELSTPVNFSLGLQLLARYEWATIATEYWHQSNAGLGSVNAGLDLIAVMGGVSFH